MTDPAADEPAPFGFKLFIAVAALYLGLRLIQGVVWLVERLR